MCSEVRLERRTVVEWEEWTNGGLEELMGTSLNLTRQRIDDRVTEVATRDCLRVFYPEK